MKHDRSAIGNGDNAASTPDLLLQRHEQEKNFERSERIAASGHIVPTSDITELIETEDEDWLDNDASK